MTTSSQTAAALAPGSALSRQPSTPIDIENLSLSFGPTQVLKGIDLSIAPGELFAFLGPSGSGKSTLLRSIAGFGPRPQGRILIGGEDVVGRMPWQRNVGMVFQNYALWPHLTVARNVAYGLEERRKPRDEIRRRVLDALKLVGMQDYANRYPSQLSGGQQQRVALARTVVVEPRVLLLDEPLSNLDANLRVQMRQDILDLQRRLGITTIFVTHDQEEANTICDRIAVIDSGVIQQVGRPADVYDNPVNVFVARFLGTANIVAGKVERGEAGRVFVSDGGLRIPVSRSTPPGPGHLVIRPQDIGLSGAGDVAPIKGTVAGTEFLGSTIRYEIKAAGVSFLVDEKHTRGTHRRDVGEAADLFIPPQHAIFLPATDAK